MNVSDWQLVKTADGSATLYSPTLNEIYHSRHGAVTESQHVFIENGLKQCPSNPVRIFELGFGTGLNALLSLHDAVLKNRVVIYETLEPYPVAVEMVKELNYAVVAAMPQLQPYYHSMHLCRWGETHLIHPQFRFCKQQLPLSEYGGKSDFDLIYFDAFSPEKQPELWTAEVFVQIREMMKSGARLVTYCSKSAVQRNLRAAGFEVKKLPGPPGKREMLAAFA